MSQTRPGRVTPVVRVLLAVHAAAGILLATVLTLPSLHRALAFQPALLDERPWTPFTYLLVPSGLLVLGVQLLLLWLLGPPVEQRLGGRLFLFYYALTGFGTALFGLGLTSFIGVPTLAGPGGAVLGTAIAFAMLWPDAYVNLEPLPFRPRVRALIAALVAATLVLSLALPDGSAYLAELGGLLTGYLFFRLRALHGRKVEPPPTPILARPLRAAVKVPHGAPPDKLRPARPQETPRERFSSEELDRVLDKISASGLASLTPEERRFLDQMAARKRKDGG